MSTHVKHKHKYSGSQMKAWLHQQPYHQPGSALPGFSNLLATLPEKVGSAEVGALLPPPWHTTLAHMSICKDYCITVNNPSEKHLDKLYALFFDGHCTYLVFSIEQPVGGTLHLQVFLQLKKKDRITGLAKKFTKHMHADKRYGTAEQASHYCKKPVADCLCNPCEEERANPTHLEGPYEFGDLSFAGKRNDVEALIKDIKEQSTMTELVEAHPGLMLRNYNNVEKIRTLYVKDRDFKSEVTVLWGAARVGKTYHAIHCYPTPYKMNDWDGTLYIADYDPLVHKTIIFDEFYGNMKFSLWKQLCDEYPMTVQTKGGFRPFRPEHIVFTSNQNPLSWYKCLAEPVHLDAFTGRIENIVYFEKDKYIITKGRLLNKEKLRLPEAAAAPAVAPAAAPAAVAALPPMFHSNMSYLDRVAMHERIAQRASAAAAGGSALNRYPLSK